MRRPPALVLLPARNDHPASWTPLAKRLQHSYDVVTPSLPGLAAGRAEVFSLEAAAQAVSAAIPRSASSATVCGIGLGAMVALQLAATAPDRVTRLVLLTRQVAVSPVLLSLPAAVLRLLPATTVQRLGAGQDQVLGLLDQVRPVDFAAVAPRVAVPAVVVCGARDRINRRASTALARALPQGELRLVPKAGPGWLTPEALAALLA